jgi:hypothetical protein
LPVARPKVRLSLLPPARRASHQYSFLGLFLLRRI